MVLRRVCLRASVLLAFAALTAGEAAAQVGGQPGKEPAAAPPAEVSVLPLAGGGNGAPGGVVKPARAVTAGLGTRATTGQSFVEEVEPNETAVAATPAGGTDVVFRGHVFPVGDVDVYSFSGTAGDKVYAATMTSASPSSLDTTLTLLGSDGTTVIETDLDDGSLGSTSSSIAGATLPASGTYYLRVIQAAGTSTVRPYHLHLKVQTGSPGVETEPNNDTATATPLPGSGWVSGVIGVAGDVDYYSVALNAGDTVFLSLDLDPERNSTTWNGRVGLSAFGSPSSILVVNDASVTSPNSEALFLTVKDAGTYHVYVDAPAGTPDATFTYGLSVGVRPAGAACTTTTSADVPKPIPDVGSVTSTLSVPAGTRIASLAVVLDLTHANMPDVDVTLTSPDGNVVALFTDVGAAAQPAMSLRIDDAAALPIGNFTIVSGLVFQPESAYRTGWFEGMDAGGTWTLTVYDDTAANTGTLTGWGLVICPEPALAGCGAGTPTTLFTTDFETGDAGFTHAGTADTWARGTPAAAPITTCRSGTNCWKTNLAGTYSASANHDLISPPIVLSSAATVPIRVSWAQKYQLESASFDRAWVEVRPVGSPTVGRILFDWRDGTMTVSPGSTAATVNESAGWAVFTRDISELAGQTVELRFHLQTDTSGQFAGLAVDDVTVSSCGALPVELQGFSVE
ncbi:MAG: pre-peptidase C-terminal domain-containing protein [Holophagales bacterium]|nr:pre-peptidase C-terminal domain-containing protein [Holophagales bacterium]